MIYLKIHFSECPSCNQEPRSLSVVSTSILSTQPISYREEWRRQRLSRHLGGSYSTWERIRSPRHHSLSRQGDTSKQNICGVWWQAWSRRRQRYHSGKSNLNQIHCQAFSSQIALSPELSTMLSKGWTLYNISLLRLTSRAVAQVVCLVSVDNRI